ncbi:MAG TPA: Rieske 2Fe-2S domain-containing protein [Burkholderiales bacterium]|nr:Rieske 2Fe-2S domain-containing protein [Burkholderiales bacterium]
MHDVSRLVERGRSHRRLYTDPALFALEMERIFRRAWLWLGHESQLREPGAFFCTRMAGERVIVVRHHDGAVYALHNRCPHRGAEVCALPSGTVHSFVCPYHAWTFRTDGALASVPLEHGYAAGFKAGERVGLERVPRVASYRGFLFGNLSPQGEDLETFLGPEVRAAFDNLVDRAPDGDVELAGGKTVQRYRGNWKLQMENSIDLLHPRILHRSAIDAADRVDHGGEPPSIEWDIVKANGLTLREWDGMRVAALPRGHCWMGGFLTAAIDERARDTPYYRRMVARHGEARVREILSFNRHNTIVYPGLFVNSRLAQIRQLQPVSVDCTEQHGYIFRLKGAPEELFEASVRMVNTNNSPSSIVTSDDHEIFERIQESLAAGRHEWVDLSRGLARDDAPEGTNEAPMRNQHRAWAQYMQG